MIFPVYIYLFALTTYDYNLNSMVTIRIFIALMKYTPWYLPIPPKLDSRNHSILNHPVNS